MKNLFVIVFLFSVFIPVAFAEKDSELQALSAWTNQSGSTLFIDSISASGQLTGTYVNRASGYQCQNSPYPVTGWIYGSAITFTTDWRNSTESCNSITAWTGFYYQGTIQTLWQLVINGSSNTNQIIKGEDIFSPATAKSYDSLVSKK